MKQFEEFWARIWDGSTNTPQRKWMNIDAKKTGPKVMNVQEFTITEKKFCQIVEK